MREKLKKIVAYLIGLAILYQIGAYLWRLI
jgi:hypothetical protein